ncbi:GntR family transcriptional regulator [Fulvivirgaceae bacterium BMA12]|uniref:GntR family transcriptional regulator n=1 Tax=Agaribacillus aureus TaxID=3051825 RepID=A0ABT8L6R2_9BACT|nr:GntR family transcriptional regulator [Fulvivirgaceae bacterium BMA12]
MEPYIFDFDIEKHPSRPKYLQLADALLADIEIGKLKLNQPLPSVNKLSKELSISRETVFKALNYLSERGVIKSANRQGYFVINTDVRRKARIFFLLDKFTTFKEQMYLSFQKTIGDQGDVEIFFHHHNLSVFRSLIIDNLPHYTHFVILTFLREDVSDILNLIPSNKRLIIDSYEPGLSGDYPMIYQDFASDIYNALEKAGDKLEKYKRLVLVAPGTLFHSDLVVRGFQKFAKDSGFPTKVVRSVDTDDFHKGDVYLTLSGYDMELVEVIKLSRSRKYKIGKDIGIISYNDTPVKEVLEDGITVINTNWKYMGSKAASMLLDQEIHTIANPTQLIFRNSL